MSDHQLSLLPDISITSRSLTLPENCTLELWEDCGEKIGICVDAGPFIIGDWINEGAKRHGIALGAFLKSHAAKKMPGISSFSYDSLNSFALVMEKLPRNYRVQGVSFAHHQTASKLVLVHDEDELEKKHALTEAQGWLQIAKDKSLSLREMAFAINGRSKLSDIKKDDPSSTSPMQVGLPLKASISDISILLHRNCQPLIAQFEDEDDPLDQWTNARKESAKLALEPIMDDLTKLTDFYISLCK